MLAAIKRTALRPPTLHASMHQLVKPPCLLEHAAPDKSVAAEVGAATPAPTYVGGAGSTCGV